MFTTLASNLAAHRPRTTLAAAALVLAGSMAHAAPADDIARLYALPPDGSVYVRVVNPSNTRVTVQLGAGEKAEMLSASGKIVSDYRVLSGGEAFPLKINGKAVEVPGKTPKGGFVTLVLQSARGTAAAKPVLDESPAADGLKAELAVYNLVPGCSAKVGVANGPTVFQSVPDGARAVRAINPVSASLAGDCAGHVSAPFALPSLKAGDRFSLFLVGTAEAPVLTGAVNRTEPYRAR